MPLPHSRPIRLASCVAMLAAACWLAGCGSGKGTSGPRGSTPSKPAYVTEPFTHEQQLVAKGARLVVSDGCAACHLASSGATLGPDFMSFAGHHVTLADGRRVLVDERYVREGLLHPAAAAIEGYDVQPMLKAIARLHLAEHPDQVAALAAFIEQIGPETE